MVSTLKADKDYVMAPTNNLQSGGRKAQRGTALIEFTLVLPMLLVLTVALILVVTLLACCIGVAGLARLRSVDPTGLL